MAQPSPSPSNSPRPKRFLITGAKGFIGAWIAKTLLEGGDPPNVFDIDPGFERLSHILGEGRTNELET
jgi:nucleoside-diphosphate-sugar epimerase